MTNILIGILKFNGIVALIVGLIGYVTLLLNFINLKRVKFEQWVNLQAGSLITALVYTSLSVLFFRWAEHIISSLGR